MLHLLIIALSTFALYLTLGWQATLSLLILNLAFFSVHGKTINEIIKALKALSDALIAVAERDNND